MIPDRLEPMAYALFRIVFGFLFLCNGLQKFGMFGGQMMATGSLPWIAGVIEAVCGLLIMIGLVTKLAAFLASGEMAVAYFLIHQPQGPLPIVNMGERSVLYCFAFLYIASRGVGMWGVDAARRHRS
jgi:putative oxidoreductase